MRLATIETGPDLRKGEGKIDGLESGSRSAIKGDTGFWKV